MANQRKLVSPLVRAIALLSLGSTACIGMSSEDRDKLAAACEGQAVAGAGAYEGGREGFAPFKRESSDAAFRYDVDGVHFKLKRPSTLAEAHTVFCMEPVQEVPEGECSFDTVEGIGIAGVSVIDVSRTKGPTFPRVSMQRTARLVDPSTGTTIAEYTHKSEARGCDQIIGEPSESVFRALPPSGISFANWVTGQLGVEP